MPLDPNIILGVQQPKFDNPLDSMGKLMAMKSLATRNQTEGLQAQQAQQEFNDQQALRNAKANNTKVNSDGTVATDQQGILKELGTTAPSLVSQVNVQQRSQAMDAQNQQIKNYSEKMGMAAQLSAGVKDQPSLDQLHKTMEDLGVQTTQVPTVWDDKSSPAVMQDLTNMALTAQQRAENQIKQQGQNIENKKIDFEMRKYGNDKQVDAYKDLMSHAESSRQLPDVKQAYTDRYNAQKVMDLVGTGDPNKLNPNMVQLVSGEVAKIAQGGVPQTEELKNITPNDAQMLMARTKQYLTNHPEASQQGAFVNVFRDYAGTIQNGANKVISDNIGKLGESYKDHLKDSDYQTFENTYVKGSPYSLKQTNDAINNSNSNQTSKTSKPDYSVAGIKSLPVGAVLNGQTKTKDGWVPLDASK